MYQQNEIIIQKTHTMTTKELTLEQLTEKMYYLIQDKVSDGNVRSELYDLLDEIEEFVEEKL